MVETGLLEPVATRPMRFHVSNLRDVQKITEDKVHISKIWNRAFQAHVRVQRLEAKVEELTSLLGAASPTLSVEKEDIVSLYKHFFKAAKVRILTLTAEEVMDWAKVLLSVDEHYLILAAHHLNTREPWQHMLWFARHVIESAPRQLFKTEKQLEVAYSYFLYAYRHLRQVSYFYCRTQRGAKEANLRFPEARDGNVTRAISALVSATLAGQKPAGVRH